MNHAFFLIPVHDDGSAAQALNSFVSQHRITQVEKHFVADGQNSCWAFCVSWLSGEGPLKNTEKRQRVGKVDYKEVLSESDFAIFARLRQLRKELAEREGVPPYHIFTNEQLAQMVIQKAASLSVLRQIEGIGEKRLERYGQTFLDALEVEQNNPDSE